MKLQSISLLVGLLFLFSCSSTNTKDKGIKFGANHLLKSENSQIIAVDNLTKQNFLSLFSFELGFAGDSCLLEESLTILATPSYASTVTEFAHRIDSDTTIMTYDLYTKKLPTELSFFGKTGSLFHAHYFAISPTLNTPFVFTVMGEDSSKVADYHISKKISERIFW